MNEVSGTSFPTVGIMGGGQLGRMMALAAIRMGLNIRFIDPNDSGPTSGLGTTIIGNWSDPILLQQFTSGCDVITVESEWAPIEAVESLPNLSVPCFPSSKTLLFIRDKGIQKEKLKNANLPVPDFALPKTLEEAFTSAKNLSYPLVLKRRQGSYDGYGNATVQNERELETAWADLADHNGALLEAWVPFVRELSVLIARRPGGKYATYPVAYTEQRNHRCHAVEVPASIPQDIAANARDIGLKAVEAVDGVGITAVELFELKDGSILINELAPRPHNTGHYSIEACYSSQFENHIRAILDWPLGSAELRVPSAVMINILGYRNHPVSVESFPNALQFPDASVHIYGKYDSRPGRKMGHVTATGGIISEVRRTAEEAARAVIL